LKKQTVVIALVLMVIIAGTSISVWIFAQTNSRARYDMSYQNGFSAGWKNGKNTGYNKGYSDGFTESNDPVNLGAGPVKFTAQELQTFEKIKNRLTLFNADPAFTGNSILQWISMRNSTSGDYYQKSMEYLCFWSV